MNAEEKQKKLEGLLSESGFDWEFIHPPNITEPILLIKNYAPPTEILRYLLLLLWQNTIREIVAGWAVNVG